MARAAVSARVLRAQRREDRLPAEPDCDVALFVCRRRTDQYGTGKRYLVAAGNGDNSRIHAVLLIRCVNVSCHGILATCVVIENYSVAEVYESKPVRARCQHTRGVLTEEFRR